MIKEVFKKPTKWSIMKTLILKEIDELVYGSMGIIIFISFFIGGVVSIQTALNITNPLVPRKVGSYITSSIGTMRVTEQIDALEIMGVNSLNYLVFPKIIAMLFYPFVIAIAMYVGIFGGWTAGVFGGFSSSADFVEGLQLDFIPFHVTYSFIKSIVFALIIATIPSFHGYYMKGGALEVGKASTTAFVWTSVVIIIVNYILTQLLLG